MIDGFKFQVSSFRLRDNKSKRMSLFNPLLFLVAVHCLLFNMTAIAYSIDVEEVLRTYLKDNYPWAEIEIKDIVSDNDAPEEVPERITIEKGPPGKTIFWLHYKDGRRITVTAQVKAFDYVVKSRRALMKGHKLQENDVYVTIMDINRIPKGCYKEKGECYW